MVILSKLDYCSSVWSPHLKGLQYILEKVQKRAAQIVLGNYHDNCCTLLKTLNWLPLHVRREMTRNTVLYQILNKYIDIPFEIYFRLRKVRPLRKANNLQIEYKKSHTVEIHFSLVLSKAGTCYQNMKGLEAKGPFLYLGLQVRSKGSIRYE